MRDARERGTNGIPLSDPDTANLAELYSSLLIKYVKSHSAYKRAREKADQVLIPKELWETEKTLEDLRERSRASQRDLYEMLANGEPVRMVLQRNVSALENAIEWMDNMTKTLNKLVHQAENKKVKANPKKRLP